jgi:hypothetical protein
MEREYAEKLAGNPALKRLASITFGHQSERGSHQSGRGAIPWR